MLLHHPDIEHPHSLHMNEQTGMLCVVQGKDGNNIEVKIFRVMPSKEYLTQMCLFVDVPKQPLDHW